MSVCDSCNNHEVTIELVSGKPVKSAICLYSHNWFQHSDARNCKDLILKDYENIPQDLED